MSTTSQKPSVPKASQKRVFGQGETKLRAGLYARVSTHDQQTLPMQLAAMRDYARKRGWQIPDPSEELGTPSQCVEALEQAGFTRVQVIPDRVVIERPDLALAWEANVRAAAALVPDRSPEAQQALRDEFLQAMQQEIAADPAAASRVDVLFAVAHRAAA